MNTKNQRNIIISFFTLIIVFIFNHDICRSAEKNLHIKNTHPEIDDIVFGYEDAKIKLIEYSSINCIHCAKFRKIFFKEFNDRFVKKHKVQLVLKHFPLDYMAVEYMSLIVNQPKKNWFNLYEKALDTQSKWIGKNSKVLGEILGISKQDCKKAASCQYTKKLIMAKRFNAENIFEINSTPTFLIIYRKKGKLHFEIINKAISPNALLDKLENACKNIS